LTSLISRRGTSLRLTSSPHQLATGVPAMMGRFRLRPSAPARVRLAVEILEDRLPVSEAIGTAQAVSALAGVGATLLPDGDPSAAPFSNADSGPTRASAFTGFLEPDFGGLKTASFPPVFAETPPSLAPARREPAELPPAARPPDLMSKDDL